MAGMLPGVECARRRRFHQSGLSSDSQNSQQGWSRRPSFCLYTSNHEKSHHITSTSFLQRGMLINQDDDKLGVEAREAKERLDERLRTQKKSEPKRKNMKSNNAVAKGEKMVQNEAMNNNNNNFSNNNNNSSSKKNKDGGGSSRVMKWARFSWKASDQEECTICLEWFKRGETLVNLPCAHRFHNTCLLPWLEANSYCPCCRMVIVS